MNADAVLQQVDAPERRLQRARPLDAGPPAKAVGEGEWGRDARV
jgi:hypothetical protein